jgi:triacylglycerol lipase
LKAPIVLAHGLFGFVRIGFGPITVAEYFRGIPEFLRATGNRVMVARVHPTAGIARRARKLAERIETAFGDEPVHLIGHSMGGLDARVLVSDPSWARRVITLTTIGTPHLGSALADAARLQMGGVYRLLRTLGLDHRGFFDVTRRTARAWHRALGRPAGIPCFSVAGLPPADEVCWPLRRLYEAVEGWEGPNDGLVALDSATAFGTPLPPWPVDHLRQMGWMASASGGPAPDQILALYAGILNELAKHDLAGPLDAPVEAAPTLEPSAVE